MIIFECNFFHHGKYVFGRSFSDQPFFNTDGKCATFVKIRAKSFPKLDSFLVLLLKNLVTHMDFLESLWSLSVCRWFVSPKRSTRSSASNSAKRLGGSIRSKNTCCFVVLTSSWHILTSLWHVSTSAWNVLAAIRLLYSFWSATSAHYGTVIDCVGCGNHWNSVKTPSTGIGNDGEAPFRLLLRATRRSLPRLMSSVCSLSWSRKVWCSCRNILHRNNTSLSTGGARGFQLPHQSWIFDLGICWSSGWTLQQMSQRCRWCPFGVFRTLSVSVLRDVSFLVTACFQYIPP